MASESTRKFVKFAATAALPLIIIAATALLGGGALLIIYSFAIVAAWKSAMAFLVIFGGGAMAVGAGLYAVNGFINYLAKYRKKYQRVYDTIKKEEKEQPQTKKKLFTLANGAFAVLLIGAILAIISMPLGSIDGKNWLEARESYMTENGYFNETKKMEYEYPVFSSASAQASAEEGTRDITPAKINKIVLNLSKKNAVVIYDENAQNVEIKYYIAYENHIMPEMENYTLTLSETPSPRLNRPKDKMLFFLFDDNEIERQIKITVPAQYKDFVEIEGAHIVAK